METKLAKMSDYVENLLFLFAREQELLDKADRTHDDNSELFTIQEQLRRDELEIKDKSDCYGHVFKKIEAWSNEVDNEIKRLQARKKSFLSQLESLKYRISSAFELLNIDKLKTALFTIGFRQSSSVVIDCPIEALPDNYIRTKTTIEADKIALKDAIKSGKEIPGVSIKQNKSITIR